MNESSNPSLRERLPLTPGPEDHFRWRGAGHISRVEGLTDAVYAFAVTLLVVSLESPRTFEGLLEVMRGFPAFVISFAILMTFWNAHFRYHRRYGFEDPFSRVMTMAILVLVLFFVYPLKFLFTMVTVNLFHLGLHDVPVLQTAAQADTLYLVYGLGFGGIWSLYAILYWHALRKREQLQLTPAELLMTRASFCEYLIHVGVCLLSIMLAETTDNNSLPGYIYVLLGPLQGLNGWLFGRKIRAVDRPATGG